MFAAGVFFLFIVAAQGNSDAPQAPPQDAVMAEPEPAPKPTPLALVTDDYAPRPLPLALQLSSAWHARRDAA